MFKYSINYNKKLLLKLHIFSTGRMPFLKSNTKTLTNHKERKSLTVPFPPLHINLSAPMACYNNNLASQSPSLSVCSLFILHLLVSKVWGSINKFQIALNT